MHHASKNKVPRSRSGARLHARRSQSKVNHAREGSPAKAAAERRGARLEAYWSAGQGRDCQTCDAQLLTGPRRAGFIPYPHLQKPYDPAELEKLGCSYRVNRLNLVEATMLSLIREDWRRKRVVSKTKN